MTRENVGSWNKMTDVDKTLDKVRKLLATANGSNVVTKNTEGQWIDFNQQQFYLDSQFLSFATPKANEMIERKCFDFWKWIIPTLISVVALLISILVLYR